MPDSNAILMPKLGLTMTEGVVASWNVKSGDTVATGDIMFVVETDKIATDVPAEEALVIDAILAAEGETVPVGATVATFIRPGSAATPTPAPSPPAQAPLPEAAADQPVANVKPSTDTATAIDSARILATPLARRIAGRNGIDLRRIQGSGPRGRIKAADLPPVPLPTAQPDVAVPAAALAGAGWSGIARKPTSIERTIAERLTAAKQSTPHFYVMADADVTELLALRSSLNADARYAKVTVNHLILLAMVRALSQMPEFNIVWTDEGIVTLDRVDVGLAVETPRGLLAPVIRDLGGRSITELVQSANQIIERARAGQLSADLLQGGAITLSNVGMFGATYLVPIINLGQSAILGAGGNRAVFRPDGNGQPVMRQEIGLTLSCDHRVHDGARAARFLNLLVSLIESPLTLLRG